MSRTLNPKTFWAPGSIGDVGREMNRLVEHFFGPEGTDSGRFFAPSLNVAETEQHYEVTVDLPGMKPEDLHVELKEGQLWITGERQHAEEEKGKTYHRVERTYGQFRRVIALGTDVDQDHVEASYKDGVLAVVVPKSPAEQPRRIQVKG